MKLIILLTLACITLQVNATNFFVSNAGSDAASGTSQGTAWATIAKLNVQLPFCVAGDSIFFRRGDAFYGQLAVPSNGSSASKRIEFLAYGTGAKPILTGYTSLGAGLWTNLGGNIWQANVNSGLNLNLVTLQGQAITQGRTPNTGSYFTIQSASHIPDQFHLTGITITSTDIPSSTHNWTGAEMVLQSSDYNRDRNPVTNHSGNTVTYTSQSAHDAPVGYKFYFQHDVSTLDQQNEWYYNSTAHTIGMYSTVDPGGLTVKAATIDNGVNYEYRSWIRFSNIKFQGYDSIGIRFFRGDGMKIENCDFDQIGAGGIISDNSRKDSIYNNNLTDIYNTGITSAFSTQQVIRYNTINRCGLINGLGQGNNQQMDGIYMVNGTDSAIIEYNTVLNVGYCGITFDGANTRVQYNYINGFGKSLSDGGGIYTCCQGDVIAATYPKFNSSKPMGRRKINANIVINSVGNKEMSANNSPGGVPNIYLDDNTGQVDITNNTVQNATRFGVLLHNARDITIQGNKIFNGAEEQAIALNHDVGNPIRNIDISNNTIYQLGLSHFIYLETGHFGEANDLSLFGAFNNNKFYRSAGGSTFATWYNGSNTDYTFAAWKSTWGWDINSTFTQVIDDRMRLVTNPSAVSITTNLGASYKDLTSGLNYASQIVLAPYSSAILRKITAFTDTGGGSGGGTATSNGTNRAQTKKGHKQTSTKINK